MSKFKTAVQLIALAMLILAPAVEHVWGGLHYAGILSLWGAAILTIYTGFSYVQANLAHVSREDERERRRRLAEARQAP